MGRRSQLVVMQPDQLDNRIMLLRDQKVMLDSSLAKLYGMRTSALLQAVKRNRDRFPTDFAFQLTQQEFMALTSQIVTSNGRGGRRRRPWVFTEHGVAMLSSVLRSPMAIRVNIEIMRAFVRVRRLLATPGELVAQLTKLAQTVQLHDDQIQAITDVLRKLIDSSSREPDRRFGFQVESSSKSQSKVKS